jgi:hypothetical protein
MVRLDDRIARMTAGAWELQMRYSQAKTALATATIEGAARKS